MQLLMEIFLIAASVVLCIAGALFLLTPSAVEKVTKVTSKVIFTLDERTVPAMRRPLGILFLATAIFVLYIAIRG